MTVPVSSAPATSTTFPSSGYNFAGLEGAYMPFGKSAVVEPAPPTDQEKTLQYLKNEHEKEIAQLKAEYEAAKKAREEEVEAEKEVIKAEKAAAEKKASRAVQDYENYCESSKEKRQKLIDDLNDAQTNNDTDKTMRELRIMKNKETTMNERIELLENKIYTAEADVENRDNTIKTLRVDNGKLKSEVKRKEKQYQWASTCVGDLEKEVDNLKSLNAQSRLRETSKQDELNKKHGTLEECQTALRTTRDTLRRTTTNHNKAQTERAQAIEEVQLFKKMVHGDGGLQARIRVADERVADLAAAVSGFSEDVPLLEKARDEALKDKEKIVAQRDQLEEQLATLTKEKENERDQLNEQLEALEIEKNVEQGQLNEQLTALEIEKNAEQGQLNEQLAALKEEKGVEREQLNEQLAALKKEMDVERDRLNEQLVALKEEKDVEGDQLNKQLVDLKEENDVGRDQLNEQRLRVEELKNLVASKIARETEAPVFGRGRQGRKAIRGSAYLAPYIEDDTSSGDDLPDKKKKVIEPELTSVEVAQSSEEDIVVPQFQPVVRPARDMRNITTTGIQIISDMEPSRTGTALAPQPPNRLHIGSAQVFSDVGPSDNVQGTTYTTGSRPEDLVISDVQVISNIPPTTEATPAPAPVVVRTTITQALPSYLLKFLMLMAVLAMLFATLMGLGARRERDSWLAANEFTRRMAWHLRMGGGSGDGFGFLSWFLSDQSLNLKAGLYG